MGGLGGNGGSVRAMRGTQHTQEPRAIHISTGLRFTSNVMMEVSVVQTELERNRAKAASGRACVAHSTLCASAVSVTGETGRRTLVQGTFGKDVLRRACSKVPM